MRRLWYRLRPWIKGDLVAEVEWSYDHRGGYYRALPGPVRRVRRWRRR